MPVQKNKTLPGLGNPVLSRSGARQNFMQPRSVAGKKVDNAPHSSFYIFDDDEDYLTSSGQYVSKYIATPKTETVRKRG